MLTKILDLALITMPDYKPPEDPALIKIYHQFDEPEDRKNRRISRIHIPKLNFRLKPKVGSIVYCGLAANQLEHSGIYIGDNRIVHLNRHGYIEIISPQQFISGITTGNEIYVSCEGEWPVGCDEVADFAESMVGIIRNYHVLVDNCHQFSAGCLMKDPENYNNFLWFLKDEAKKRLGADNWRLWDKNYW